MKKYIIKCESEVDEGGSMDKLRGFIIEMLYGLVDIMEGRNKYEPNWDQVFGKVMEEVRK